MMRFKILLFFIFSFSCAAFSQQKFRDTVVAALHGVADSTGKIIVPADYDEIEMVTYDALDWNTNEHISSGETLFKVRKGKLWGLLSQRGDILLETKYEDVVVDYGDSGTYRIIMAKQNKKYALFDPFGRILTKFEFTTIDTGNFPDDVVAYVTKKGKKILLVNKQGLIVSGNNSAE